MSRHSRASSATTAIPFWRSNFAWTGVDRFENGDPRRIRKLEKARPIDAGVALALAVWRVVVGDGESNYARGERLVVITAAEPETQASVRYIDGEPVALP